jgi:hypothetical protein
MISSLEYRMDDRTPDEFKRYIELGHAKERIYIRAFNVDLLARGFQTCGYRDNGVDNSGRVIKGPLGNCNADYKIWGITSTDDPWEIKVNTEWPKYMTYKLSNLEAYIAQNARILSPNTAGYYILSVPAMQTIMQECTCRFDHSGFKKKWAYRAGIGTGPKSLMAAERAGLTEKEIGLVDRLMDRGLIMHRKWTPEAIKIIDEHRPLLLTRYS